MVFMGMEMELGTSDERVVSVGMGMGRYWEGSTGRWHDARSFFAAHAVAL